MTTMKIKVEYGQSDSNGTCIASRYEADLDEAFLLLKDLLDSRDHLLDKAKERIEFNK